MTQTLRIALVIVCAAVYLQFSPGRILFPDDEIVYQTTRSLYERGSVAIEGIPRRTGEPKKRPTGTFGWAPGTDGKRYGFFGHGLSVAAIPLYALGKQVQQHAPETWRHAIRSDAFFLHPRSPGNDWPRMLVSFTNCIVTALAALVLAEWLVALGYTARVAMMTALTYALGTSAWAYAGTFLSEPLSALLLLGAAWCVTRFFAQASQPNPQGAGWLMLASGLVAASVHTHVLNVVAVPAYVAWVLTALRRRGALRDHQRALIAAAAVGAVGLAMLGASQAARFGSPFETGRYGHYSHFVVPADGLLAMVLAPGRSLWLYSPALLLALPGTRAFVARHRDVAIFIGVLAVSRWVFVASRSDWWGGWAIGPRYLLPLVPFMLIPLAEVLTRAGTASRRAKVTLGVALTACVGLSMHLAAHNIFEHMVRISKREAAGTMRYIDISHWVPSASPIVGFNDLPIDTLAHGSLRLAEHGHSGLAWVFGAVAGLGVVAGLVLARRLLARSSD